MYLVGILVRPRLPLPLPPPRPVPVLEQYWYRHRDRDGQPLIGGLLHRLFSSSFWTLDETVWNPCSVWDPLPSRVELPIGLRGTVPAVPLYLL